MSATALMPYGMVTVLCKHWQRAATIFGTVLMIGLLYLLFAQPKYESVAELVVTFGDRSIPEVGQSRPVEMTPSDRREIVLSHAAILESHDIAQATIEALGLETIYPKLAHHKPSRGSQMDAAVKEFHDNLLVDVGVQDNILTIAFRHPDPNVAPQVVAKMIELYVTHQTTVYHNPHKEFLNHETQAANDRLAAAQTALEQFKEQWRITDYDKEVEDLLAQRGDLDNDLHTAKANLAQAQHRQQDLKGLMGNVPQNLPESASSEKYRALDDARTRLADLKTKQAQMLATYQPNSPAMASLNAGIAAAEHEVEQRSAELNQRHTSQPNQVFQSMQTDMLRTSADAQSYSEPVRVLGEEVAAIDKRLGELQKNRGKYNDLLREHQIAEENYRTLATQFNEARVKGGMNESHISPAVVISEPTKPYRTVRPRSLVTLLACLAGGAILAIGGALMREALDDRFATAEQVAYLLDLPVLASFERRPDNNKPQLMLGGAE